VLILVSDSDDVFLRPVCLLTDFSSVALVPKVDLVFYNVDYNDVASLSFLDVKFIDLDLALYFFKRSCCSTD